MKLFFRSIYEGGSRCKIKNFLGENFIQEFTEIHKIVRRWYILFLHLVIIVAQNLLHHKRIKTCIEEMSVKVVGPHLEDQLIFVIASEMRTSQVFLQPYEAIEITGFKFRFVCSAEILVQTGNLCPRQRNTLVCNTK